MVWALGFILTVGVIAYVGYPLFARPATAREDALELAIAQRRRARAGTVADAEAGSLVCAGCGAKNVRGDRYCARCGASLETRCPGCGRPHTPDDRFCSGCGAKLTRRQR